MMAAANNVSGVKYWPHQKMAAESAVMAK